MNFRPFGNRGLSLIELMASLAITSVGLILFTSSGTRLSNASRRLKDYIAAEALGMEVLELFRSQTSARFQQYLQTSGTAGPYLLCSHNNILDRVSGTVTNPDPLADLPSVTLGENSSPKLSPNRFVLVEVVDMTTMQPNIADCLLDATTVVLGPNERFYVTVGVSWIPKGKNVADVTRVVMSTIIP